MSLHANQPDYLQPSSYHLLAPDDSYGLAHYPVSHHPVIGDHLLGHPQGTAPHYLTEERPPARLQSIDPMPVHLLSLGSPAIGMTLMMGSFSVLLTFFWLRICRLTSLVRRRDQRIKSLLSLDSLTSLSNRETLFKVGKRLMQAHPNAEIGLLSVSIHRLKYVNDEFGHAVGDELLQQIGHRLQACLGPKDTLARTGGDEFSLLLNSCSESSAKALAHRLLGSIHQPFYIQSQTIEVQASLGIARLIAPPIARSVHASSVVRFEQLLSQSNIALGQAKKISAAAVDPSRRYVLFAPELAAQQAYQLQMRHDLIRAIDRQELRLRYQPIVSLKSASLKGEGAGSTSLQAHADANSVDFETVGFEVLVRWEHPTLGLLGPDRFLPLAEEMGLIVALDRWVMEAACLQLQKWRSQQLTPYLSINLSGVQLSQPDVASFVRSLLSRYAIPPSQLNLEVTETVLIADPAQAIDTLRQLKRMGLRLSLDDFGTGYSSLEYLHQFPVDVLKVDKSFINKMNQETSHTEDHSPSADEHSDERSKDIYGRSYSQSSTQSQVIVRSILSLAQGLGLDVVAEGIERVDQYQQLQQMQCTYGQGNLFAKPMTGISALSLLKQGL